MQRNTGPTPGQRLTALKQGSIPMGGSQGGLCPEDNGSFYKYKWVLLAWAGPTGLPGWATLGSKGGDRLPSAGCTGASSQPSTLPSGRAWYSFLLL